MVIAHLLLNSQTVEVLPMKLAFQGSQTIPIYWMRELTLSGMSGITIQPLPRSSELRYIICHACRGLFAFLQTLKMQYSPGVSVIPVLE